MGWLSAPFLRAAASNGGGPGGVGLRGLSANRLPTKERELEGQRSLALPRPKALADFGKSPATVHVKRGSSSLPMVPDSIGLTDEASPRCTFQIM